MIIKGMPVGTIQANCYIVSDENTRECFVIDPGEESNRIMKYLEDNDLTCKYILLTHGHFDHTGAVNAVHEQTNAPVCMHELEVTRDPKEEGIRFTPPEGSLAIKEGSKIHINDLTMEVIETPGHSLGGVCFICENSIFTGDTLFRDSCGRMDLPGGEVEAMENSLRRLANLPGDYDVYPGHMEPTTLERERRFNFYMKGLL